VPGEGFPYQADVTTCTWTVTLSATGDVPVSAARSFVTKRIQHLTMSHDVRSELTNNDFTRRPVEPPPMSR